MKNNEVLSRSRDLLLKLHKSLVDFERETYVSFNGEVSPVQFLTQLLENKDLAWLRRFSTLIVDIDEMFAQRDGFNDETVEIHLAAIKSLISLRTDDPEFRGKYQLALQGDPEAAGLHAELRKVLDEA
ncbi:MAG: hypothetical protein ACR2IH_13140 [Pyrinomonadaceae bacterium]